MPKFSKADAFRVFLSIFRLNGTISIPYACYELGDQNNTEMHVTVWNAPAKRLGLVQ